MQSSKKRILCVDDDADTREMVTMLLAGLANYEVTTAHTTASALRLVRSGRFDLYLLDDRLPDGTGLDLCERIREFDPHTPILLYVATVSFTWQQVIDAGGQGYVRKLDGVDALKQTISRLLDGGAVT